MNPQPITITTPALLDAACNAVALAMRDSLTWLDNAYGRAVKRERMQDGQRVIYPAIYAGGGEYLRLFPDEHLGNFCWMDVQDGYSVDWIARKYWRVRATAGLIVWFDLRSVYPSTYDSNTEENVKSAVLGALRSALSPALRFTVSRAWDRSENIFRGYSLSEVDNQFMMRPYGCFRLDGELVYETACTDGD